MFHHSLLAGWFISSEGYRKDACVPDWYQWQDILAQVFKGEDTNRAEITNSLLFRKVAGVCERGVDE